MKKVIVGLSGGVDSSVAALLLKEAGYDVLGVFMKNWEEVDEEGRCQAEKDYLDVVSVAHKLKIPYYQMNFSKEYWEHVFAVCLEDFKKGFTPNPDILCNREIKFKVFLKKALELGADYVATGHYCQKIYKEGRYFLARGEDCEKDQSYFLYTLQENDLKKILFPIGHLQKKEVRALAKKAGLITAEKKDSTGICFIGKRNFREFLSRFLEKKKGPFQTLCGKVVGEHDGVYFYTLGQRRGLGLGGKKGCLEEAWFVVGKDVEKNIVFVAQGGNNEALHASSHYAEGTSWIHPPSFPLYCHAKIRYRSPDVACRVTQNVKQLYIEWETPQKAATPKQSVVFYEKNICLGGAFLI